ncbi:hypothetical protein H9P43_009256 [Blastocladiella emersonii ATCC 22665]|nr:hypothetical protein H9P43_009256 [Blastocladiella emersonii ATCC 22665]
MAMVVVMMTRSSRGSDGKEQQSKLAIVGEYDTTRLFADQYYARRRLSLTYSSLPLSKLNFPLCDDLKTLQGAPTSVVPEMQRPPPDRLDHQLRSMAKLTLNTVLSPTAPRLLRVDFIDFIDFRDKNARASTTKLRPATTRRDAPRRDATRMASSNHHHPRPADIAVFVSAAAAAAPAWRSYDTKGLESPERSTAGAPLARDDDNYDYSNTYGMHSGTHLGRELKKGYDDSVIIEMNDGMIDCELITIHETTKTTYGINEWTDIQQHSSSLLALYTYTYTYTDGLGGYISTTAPSHVRVDRDEVKIKENRGRGRITRQLDDIANSTVFESFFLRAPVLASVLASIFDAAATATSGASQRQRLCFRDGTLRLFCA